MSEVVHAHTLWWIYDQVANLPVQCGYQTAEFGISSAIYYTPI